MGQQAVSGPSADLGRDVKKQVSNLSSGSRSKRTRERRRGKGKEELSVNLYGSPP
jgi:hypothetical protein